MSIEVHALSGSPFVWRVLLALEHKGLVYTPVWHQLSTGELRLPSYLALNPRARVPTIVDGEHVLFESTAILAYLEARTPSPPMFGSSPAETGLVWRLVSECVVYLDPLMEAYSVPIYFGRAQAEAEALRATLAAALPELDRWEELAAGPFLAGERPSAADFVLLPAVKTFERAGGKPSAHEIGVGLPAVAERWPRLHAWTRRMEGLPGYARTYPPHWR